MNPGSLPGRACSRAQRRLAFLAAAAGVFGAQGYQGASMADIAGAAGAATGTLYLYFQNKEELYVALLEEKILELSREVKGAARDETAAWAVLARAVRAQLEFYERNRTFFQTFVRERLEMKARLQRRNWKRVTGAVERHTRLLSGFIRRGQRQGVVRKGDARRLALALLGMINQLAREGLSHRRSEGLAAQAEWIVDLFAQGARQP
ncbi:MAG: TetR family transcriptional regulator [Verrucomicrobiota bacterium]|jgi:TetR/AcrR family fatty acid metabolism transcriptional regulator